LQALTEAAEKTGGVVIRSNRFKLLQKSAFYTAGATTKRFRHNKFAERLTCFIEISLA
jgi:hypothetical protein